MRKKFSEALVSGPRRFKFLDLAVSVLPTSKSDHADLPPWPVDGMNTYESGVSPSYLGGFTGFFEGACHPFGWKTSAFLLYVNFFKAALYDEFFFVRAGFY